MRFGSRIGMQRSGSPGLSSLVVRLLFGLVLLSLAACDTSPEPQPPSAILLHGERVAAGEPFELSVSGRALDDSTRAVLTLDHGNRAQVINGLPLWGTILGIEMQDGFAYVANNTRGLVVVDVRDFSRPVVAGSLELPGKTLQVLPHGDLLVAANELSGVHLVDISTPAKPVLLATINPGGRAFDLDIAGNLLYVAAGLAGLQVIDISSPAQPVLVSRVELPGRSLAVKQQDGHVYLAGTNGLATVDVARPEYPVLRGILPLEHNAFQIVAHGKQLYVTLGYQGFLVVDLQQPERPRVVGQMNDLGNVLRMVIESGRAYLASNFGTLVVDIETDPLPTLLGGVSGRQRLTDLVVKNGIVLTADTYYGLEVVDLRSPRPFAYDRLADAEFPPVLYDVRLQQPVALQDSASSLANSTISLIDTLELLSGEPSRLFASNATALAQRGGRLFLGTEQGILTLDVARSNQFDRVDRSADGLPIEDLLSVEGYLLAAGGDQGLLVYQLDTADLPVLVRQIPLNGFASALAVRGGYLYLTLLKDGLLVFDLNDPAMPRPVASLPHPYPLDEFSRAGDIVIHKDLAYIADGPNGLRIIDLTVPAAPVMVALLQTGDSARSLTIREPYLYLADARGGLRVYDISQPRHPVFISRVWMRISVRACLATDQSLLISTVQSGLFRLEKPIEALAQRPLDESGRIFAFPAVARPGRYNLRVFNRAGGEELIGGVVIDPAGSGL